MSPTPIPIRCSHGRSPRLCDECAPPTPMPDDFREQVAARRDAVRAQVERDRMLGEALRDAETPDRSEL